MWFKDNGDISLCVSARGTKLIVHQGKPSVSSGHTEEYLVCWDMTKRWEEYWWGRMKIDETVQSTSYLSVRTARLTDVRCFLRDPSQYTATYSQTCRKWLIHKMLVQKFVTCDLWLFPKLAFVSAQHSFNWIKYCALAPLAEVANKENLWILLKYFLFCENKKISLNCKTQQF